MWSTQDQGGNWVLASGGAFGLPNVSSASPVKGITVDPSNFLAQAKLGTTLGKSGHYQEAAAHLEAALKIDPYSADARLALGLAYLSLGRHPEALAQASALDPIDQASAAQLRSLAQRVR